MYLLNYSDMQVKVKSVYLYEWVSLHCIVSYTKVGSLVRGSIADAGGLRVGHQIIEINKKSVVDMPHKEILNILSTVIGQVGVAIQRWYMR